MNVLVAGGEHEHQRDDHAIEHGRRPEEAANQRGVAPDERVVVLLEGAREIEGARNEVQAEYREQCLRCLTLHLGHSRGEGKRQ